VEKKKRAFVQSPPPQGLANGPANPHLSAGVASCSALTGMGGGSRDLPPVLRSSSSGIKPDYRDGTDISRAVTKTFGSWRNMKLKTVNLSL